MGQEEKKPIIHYYYIAGEILKFGGALIHFSALTLSSFAKIAEIRKRFPSSEVKKTSLKKIIGGGK